MRLFRGVVVGAVLLGLVLATTVVIFICTMLKPEDGGALADRLVYDRADQISDRFDGPWNGSLDPETIAATEFTGLSTDTVAVTPLRWGMVTGTSADPNDPMFYVDLQLSGRVEATSSTAVFGHSSTSGSARRCFGYLFREGEDVGRVEITCPQSDTPVREPRSRAAADLPDDTGERLKTVLRGANSVTLQRELDEAFPEAEVTAQGESTADGELVAAAGATNGSCQVWIRDEADNIRRIFFDREWVQAGELGCTPQLYTSPPP